MKGGNRGGHRPKGSKNVNPTKDIRKWGHRWENQSDIELIQAMADRLGKKPGIMMQEVTIEFCKNR